MSSVAETETPSSSSSSPILPSSTDQLLMEAGIKREYLERLASKHPTPLRLKDMYHLGASPAPDQRMRNAQFLYQELPIRIAQRAMDLLTLPHGLSEAVPIQQVASIYLNFLRRFQDFPMPTTDLEEQAFTDMLQVFVLDRTSIPVSIAQGVHAWWKISNKTEDDGEDDCDEADRLHEMEEALYRFFTARVGLRFLTEHYVLSSNRDSATALRHVTSMFPASNGSSSSSSTTNNNNTSTKQEGLIQANVCVVEEIRRVADLVTHQTKEFYNGLCPIIDIVDCVENKQHDKTQPFTYVPQHLHYMMTELLKNSCRASIRKYRQEAAAAQQQDNKEESNSSGGDPSIEIPRIRIVIVKGAEDVTIKVADKGGGIPRSLLPTIWKFAHSTACQEEQDSAFGTDVSGARIRGFGLPLARIYARYFGGELTLKSTEGYGLDAYLHLPRLGDACEKLPLRVRDSPGERDSMPMNIQQLLTTTSGGKKSAAQKKSSKRSSSSSSSSSGAPPVVRTYYSTAQEQPQRRPEPSTSSAAETPTALGPLNALAGRIIPTLGL